MPTVEADDRSEEITVTEEEVANQPDIDETWEPISRTVYVARLREIRGKFRAKKRFFEDLLEELEEARKNREVTIYCYESDDDVRMVSVEKGQMGFIGKKVEYAHPEGYEQISQTRYVRVIRDMIDSASEELEQVENLLHALEDAEENSCLRIKFFETKEGAVIMRLEEKSSPGFRLT